ncbi:MAG: GTP pyrophosphokinase family protein [Gordonia sp. (in: high G+C Gram-positive bacteria)]
MDIEQKPPWSGKKLAKLGDAIVDNTDVPSDCPTYPEVMSWHSDLCAEIALRIGLHEPWKSYSGEMDITARAKTIDTLREKLVREPLRLNQVQDLAGVRIDIDAPLGIQTALSDEIRQFFGVERAEIKDIRTNPHSGYRAVHVWLRLPAGRVEVQIRTRGQSAWANSYERLGDLVGRHIRYGSTTGSTIIRETIAQMQGLSESLAQAERVEQEMFETEAAIAHLNRKIDAAIAQLGHSMSTEDFQALKQHQENARSKVAHLKNRAATQLRKYIDGLEHIQRILDDEAQTEDGDMNARIRD